MGAKDYDFCGYATRNDVKCTDGRIIRKNAFMHNDGKKVPIVWNHNHGSVDNVLGYGILHNVEDGVKVDGYLNSTVNGETAKGILAHGDVTGLSIFANHLKQDGVNVVHGDIKEVSLVLAGANKGAYIEEVLAHGEDECECATVYCNEGVDYMYHSEYGNYDEELDDELDYDDELEHADDEEDDDENGSSDGETLKDVFNTLNAKQKKMVYVLLAMSAQKSKGETVEHSDMEDDEMPRNVFETYANENAGQPTLSHSDMDTIFKDAKRVGSLKESIQQHMESGVLMHSVYNHDGQDGAAGSVQEYGIADIDYLFPDYKNLTERPEFIRRPQEWVSKVMTGVHHTPFTRIKSMFADVTMEEARAKGYIKGERKKEEVFSLLKRTTDPATIYKKQKLDKDDITDINSFDVVAWIKAEMRVMLDEEIARAILVGDGRLPSDEDKIPEDHIRPIATEADLFNVKIPVGTLNPVSGIKDFMNQIIRSRKFYRGTGNPTMFTSEDILTEMLLVEDGIGRKLYNNVGDLATALRVKEIVPVPFLDPAIHSTDVLAIIVNMADYNVGADKGGQTSMFDDFDIDYNQYKYLIETRISGALTVPFSALTFISDPNGTLPQPTYPDNGAFTPDYTPANGTDVEPGGSSLGG